MSDDYAAIVDACGGFILATSPPSGWARADGSWDVVRHLDPTTRRRLVIVGMAGAALTDTAENRRVAQTGRARRALKGRPAGPDELAWAITETGHVPAAQSATWDASAAVEWYVAAVLSVQTARRAPGLDDRPEPDPLPGWVTEWIARLACPLKRTFALSAAEAVYWGWPDPPPTGKPWEDKVWAKLGRRYAAEMARGQGVAR